MTQYRGGLMISTLRLDGTPLDVGDEVIGSLLEALREHDGAIEVEQDRIVIVFSFDASLPPGFAPGLVPAMPRLLAIGRSALVASGIDADVIGLSVERVSDG